MTLLQADTLTVGYGTTDEIVRGVSLHVAAGEIVSIIGPNGAGKSTLLKTIAGVLRPRSGVITFAGQDISSASPRRRAMLGLTYVAQERNIFAALNVRENLEMGGYGIPVSTRRERLEQVLDRMPVLRPRLGENAARLSGGQRQMLALAAALMAAPQLILLDEPSAGLSPAATQQLFDVLVAVRDTGIALLMIEQNVMDALNISDRAYVVVLGRNMQDGPAEQIASDPNIRKTFLGL